MNSNRAAVVRRRRLAVSTPAATILATGAVLVATQLPASSHQRVSSTPQPTSLRQAVSSYIKQRDGAISVAVYDDVAKRLVVIRPKLRGRTASIVKVDILQTLLHKTHGDLTDEQRRAARAMIERSDNEAATQLWDDDGRASGVHAYNDHVGLKQTEPNFHWGLTTTSAADQVTLVRELLQHNALLTNASRTFQRRLMRHVDTDQQWGISGGLPSDAKFGIKDGWLPVLGDRDQWAVDSIGWVRGDGKRYEIAVITQHNDTEGYGIRTIEHIAALAWAHTSAATHG